MKLYLFLLVTLFVNIRGNFSIDPNKMYLVNQALLQDGNYIDITINDIHYRGSRIWMERWNIIKDALDYQGLKILDLGCFLGINSICLKKYGRAKSVTGVDHDFLIGAEKLAQAFDVEINFIKADFDHDYVNYEKLIGYDYDIVFCLSLFHWIQKKDRFLSYLSNFNTIIYEGHEKAEVEIERFKKFGFKAKVLGISYSGLHQMTAAGRAIILFYK